MQIGALGSAQQAVAHHRVAAETETLACGLDAPGKTNPAPGQFWSEAKTVAVLDLLASRSPAVSFNRLPAAQLADLGANKLTGSCFAITERDVAVINQPEQRFDDACGTRRSVNLERLAAALDMARD